MILVYHITSLTRDNDRAYRECLKLLGQNSTFVISDFALAETVYILSSLYGKSRMEIIDLLTFFLTRYDGVIEYNRPLMRSVFPFYLNHPKLSFSDYCLATMAEINGAEPLFTLDKKLASQHPSAKFLS